MVVRLRSGFAGSKAEQGTLDGQATGCGTH
jgi:hypothetical protein